MILRRIQLMEPRYLGEGVPAFKDELRVWIDGVSDENIKTLDNFLTDKYLLRAEASGSRVDGYRTLEFANNSLYQLRMPGNLCMVYTRVKHELDNYYRAVRSDLNEQKLQRGIKFESAQTYQETLLAFIRNAEKTYGLRMLQSTLESGSSVLVEVLADPTKVIEVTSWGDAPKGDLDNEPLSGSLVRLRFLPYEKQTETVRELRNLLVGEMDMTYETPLHKKILNEVLDGSRKEYNEYAIFEYREQQRKLQEQGRLPSVFPEQP